MLYDNGRSLFYEDTEEMVNKAVNEPALYATTFGYSGTDWDYVLELARERGGLRGLINLEVCEAEVSSILAKAGFTYRFGGVLEWILKTMEMVRSLS